MTGRNGARGNGPDRPGRGTPGGDPAEGFAGEIVFDFHDGYAEDRRDGTEDGGPPRRGRLAPLRRVPAALLALLLAGTGWFVADGGLERWTRDRALESACDGLLPVARARAALGPGSVAEARDERVVRGTDGRPDGGPPLQVRCVITRSGGGGGEFPGGKGRLDIAVRSVPAAGEPDTGAVYYEGTAARRPVPLGHGWNGFYDDRGGTDGARTAAGLAAVLLDCPAGADGAAGTGDLLVTAASEIEGGGVDDPADRVRLAALATAVATAAADRYDCAARRGSTPRTVPQAPVRDEAVAPGAARGSCAGVRPGFRGARLLESPGGPAPRGYCEVVGAGGAEEFGGAARGAAAGYVLAAYYGPYARELRQKLRDDPVLDRVWTASAGCGPGEEPALYTAHTESGAPVGPDGRSSLAAFAARSARDQGCAAPSAPREHRTPDDTAAPSGD
ncbi:hypothetical protein ACWDR0_07540 [Streptomyces sp. NPDC003691]